MKIIADTSIWIEFLKFNEEYYYPFKKKLENLEIFAVECIFGELLQGIKSKNEQQIILKYWDSLPKLSEAGILIKAGIYSADNNLINKGIGLIDSILIVLAQENRLKIWTKDKKLCNVLDENLIFSLTDFS
ncbi:PIN domain-containing protein [bacterium]|nr:PIN domain-containing protein [bacterium]